jgi:hypothetical protein
MMVKAIVASDVNGSTATIRNRRRHRPQQNRSSTTTAYTALMTSDTAAATVTRFQKIAKGLNRSRRRATLDDAIFKQA